MKILNLVLTSLLIGQLAFAGKTGDDTWQIGNPTSSSDKKLLFDTGDGASNKYWLLDHTTKKLSSNVDQITFGSGAAANQSLIFNRGGSNPAVRWNEANSVIEFSNDGTSYQNIGSGSGSGGGGLSILATNPDLEQSLALGWTATGLSFTAVTVGSNLLFGKQSGLVTASAGSQTLISDAYVVPKGLYGANCQAKFFYQGGDANYKLQALDGSNTLIAEHALPGANATTQPYSIYFPCPGSGSLKIAIASTAAGAAMAVDRFTIGEADFGQTSQAKLVGVVKTAATSGCVWGPLSLSGSPQNFAAQASCPTAVATGDLLPPATKIPGFKASLPKGDYLIVFNSYALSDPGKGYGYIGNGTDVSNTATMFGDITTGDGVTGSSTFRMTVTDTTLQTYQIYAKGAAGASYLQADAGQGDTTFTVYRFPSGEDTVYKPQTVGWLVEADIATSSSYNIPNGFGGGFGGTNDVQSSTITVTPGPGSMGFMVPCDGGNDSTGLTCSAGNPVFGAAFVPPRQGIVDVCARFLSTTTSNNSITIEPTYRIVRTSNTTGDTVLDVGDGNRDFDFSNMGAATNSANSHSHNFCTRFNLTSTSTKVTFRLQASTDGNAYSVIDRNATFTVTPITQQMPMPVLVNSVVAPVDGVTQIAAFHLNGSDCSVVSQVGSSVGSTTHPGTGNCHIVWPAGLFSQAPICTFSTQTSGTRTCAELSQSGISSIDSNCFITNTGALSNEDVFATCMGVH